MGGRRHFKAQMALRAGCERNIVGDVVQNDSNRIWWEKTAEDGELRIAISAKGIRPSFQIGS